MYMRSALAEAERGLGFTSPNPAVGAVIVRDGQVMAAGYHRAAGQPHAEIEAIRALKDPELAAGATLYVTLEPCSTHGRTPPCTSAIIAHRFARVVYGATDPNPAHAGRANDLLSAAGIEVTAGVLSEECAAINAFWNHWIVTGRPFVVAKCGMSVDGRIASHPESRWITSPTARRDAMRLRAKVDAVLVGGNTARVDNPRLTIRGIRAGRQPLRVVWTRSGQLPADLHLFTDDHRDRTRVFQTDSLAEVLAGLGNLGITSVLIEGGGHTLGAAFDSGLVDSVVFYVAPVLLGGAVPAVGGHGVGSNAEGIRLEDPEYTKVGPDLRITGRVRRSAGL
jgi:diaminohydroxyphosphoribosylaminopyrimidine deaminase/5-amino-6-(5-phosphoribosylamino)uracil reductase